MSFFQHNGCREFLPAVDFSIDPVEQEFFREKAGIIVRRGGCSFVTKSINIQKLGAKLAVIVDS